MSRDVLNINISPINIAEIKVADHSFINVRYTYQLIYDSDQNKAFLQCDLVTKDNTVISEHLDLDVNMLIASLNNGTLMSSYLKGKRMELILQLHRRNNALLALQMMTTSTAELTQSRGYLNIGNKMIAVYKSTLTSSPFLFPYNYDTAHLSPISKITLKINTASKMWDNANHNTDVILKSINNHDDMVLTSFLNDGRGIYVLTGSYSDGYIDINHVSTVLETDYRATFQNHELSLDDLVAAVFPKDPQKTIVKAKASNGASAVLSIFKKNGKKG